MLLAELHGKSRLDLEDLEDLLTSAVFGHLRLIEPPLFWLEIFSRAKTVEEPTRTLAAILSSSGIDLASLSTLQTRFWPYFSAYGEPDLLLHFSDGARISITILIEVKLHAGKSGVGEFDQLAKYLALLDDSSSQFGWELDRNNAFVIYLTKTFAHTELVESVHASGDPGSQGRIFGLEWNDLAEVAQRQRQRSALLGEVADFLRRRGFERFRGFHVPTDLLVSSRHFYSRRFFEASDELELAQDGRFYGR